MTLSKATNYTIEKLPIEHLDVVDSTNSYLRRMIADGALDPRTAAAVRADKQTQGRGRRGRTWLNTDGALMMSIAVPVIDAAAVPLVPAAAALGVLYAVRTLLPDVAIKWPNDVVSILDKGYLKLCGILSELVFDGSQSLFAVIGVGINTNCTSMPAELLQPSASIRMLTGEQVDNDSLAVRLYDCVTGSLGALYTNKRGIIDEFASNCMTLGRRVRADDSFGNTIIGTASALDDECHLIVESDKGQITLLASDVSVLPYD